MDGLRARAGKADRGFSHRKCYKLLKYNTLFAFCGIPPLGGVILEGRRSSREKSGVGAIFKFKFSKYLEAV